MVADEEGDAEAALEAADAEAHRRLAHPQILCRAGKAAEAGRRLEDQEIARGRHGTAQELHKLLLSEQAERKRDYPLGSIAQLAISHYAFDYKNKRTLCNAYRSRGLRPEQGAARPAGGKHPALVVVPRSMSRG
jgi:hypothetical protein